jgi:hypothetical protein
MAQYYSIAEYMDFAEDDDAPTTPKASLQQYDNYQIYSLVCCDYPFKGTSLQKKKVRVAQRKPQSDTFFGYVETDVFEDRQLYKYVSDGKAFKAIAFQRYAPIKMPIDFDTIAAKLVIQPHDYYIYRYRASVNSLGSYTDYLNQLAPRPQGFFDGFDLSPFTNSENINGYNYVVFNYSEYGSSPISPRSFVRIFSIMQDRFISGGKIDPLLEMSALITGYSADPRSRPSNYPQIKPLYSGNLSISYYRQNIYEPISEITSLDWYTYNVQLSKGKNICLPLIDPVFGTLIITGEQNLVSDAKSQLVNSESGRYRWSDFYVENVDDIIGQWRAIYDSFPPQSPPDETLDIFEKNYAVHGAPILRVLSANNNHWNNDDINYNDTNFIEDHRLFIVDDKRGYEAHIMDQSDGSYGNLVMNSPKLEDIWNAIEAGKYAINSLDETKPRVTNLGHLVEKIAFLLGYRPDDNGEFSKAVEETRVRKILPANKSVDPKKVGVNNFGDEGMILSRNINRFKNKDIVDDECVVIQDLIQLLSEFQDRDNVAFGKQESSAVEINNANGKSRYNNQLEMLIEIVNLVKDSNDMVRAALVSGLVTQGQTSEIISGLGLPSVTKTLPVSIDGKDKQIPYKGIAAHRSISQEIATCTYNVGIVTGQLI